MNKKFEKWLTIAALGSWVASIGTLVAIEVTTPQITSDLVVSSESQAPRFYGRHSQFAAVLDSQFYLQLKQSNSTIGLESERVHWLDRTLISHEVLDRDFFEAEVKSQPSNFSSSEETLTHNRRLTSVLMLAQLPESWNRSLKK